MFRLNINIESAASLDRSSIMACTRFPLLYSRRVLQMNEIKGLPVPVGDLGSALDYYRSLDETLRIDLRHSLIRVIVMLFGATVVLLAWIFIFTNLLGLF